MVSLSHNTLRKIYLLFPIIIILFPTFPQYLEGTIGDQLIFIGSFVVVLFFLLLGVYGISNDSLPIFYVSLFLFLTTISLICDFYNGHIVFNDIFELSRPIVFFFFYMFYRKSRLDLSSLEKIAIKAIIIIFAILVIYSILEFLFPEVLRNVSFLLYKREAKTILINKAIGSFNKTYEFAYILLLPLSYSLIMLLRKTSLINLIIFLSVFFTLLLTQSRSMYITAAVCFAVIFLLPYFYRHTKSSLKTISIILFIILAVAVIFTIYYDEIMETFSYAAYGFNAMSEGESRSVNTRFGQIQWAWENNKLLLVGGGISKKLMLLESLYSLYLYRYGVIGLLAFIVIPMVTAVRAYRIAIFEFKNIKLSCFYLSLSVFYLITPVGLLSSCNQDTPKVSLLFYGLIGLVCNKYCAVIKKHTALTEWNSNFICK